MLTASILWAVALLNTAAASTKEPQTADYENIPGVNPLIGIQPPSPYKYLQYTGYGLGAPVPGTITIQASSPSNAIFAPYVLAGGPLVAPSISLATDSKATSFDLKAIADGCFAATQNGVIAPAVNCTIRYTAVKRNGKTVTYDSVFGVGNKLGIALKAVPVVRHMFPLRVFADVVEIRPEILKAVVPIATVQMAFDDMKYDVNFK